MRIVRGILAIMVLAQMSFAAKVDRLRDVQRILVLGDSITQAGDYVVDMECWLLTKGIHVEVLNMGLASETVTDLTQQENQGHVRRHKFARPAVSDRLERVLEATKPDLVIAVYGMNDGSSLPDDESGDKRFADAITALRGAALAAGAKRVVICTPPVHDSGNSEVPGIHDGKLARYSAWIRSQTDWEVVDIHGPMRKALDEAREKKPGFRFAKDGVHPGRDGHWLMAREILNQLFDAAITADVESAERLFSSNGAEIRRLVTERSKLRFDTWMRYVPHKRPGVPGGPRSRPGLSLAETETKALAITEQIRELLP
jgi:lysophospholipase L1-like esterase